MRRKNCVYCVKHNFEFLNAEKKEKIISLCGTDGIQITSVISNKISFEKLKREVRETWGE